MKKLFLALILLLSFGGVGHADNADNVRAALPGTYAVRGWFAGVDQSAPPSYQSTMVIKSTGQNAYQVEWNNLVGIGLATVTPQGGVVLSVGYEYESKPGIAVYDVTWTSGHCHLSNGRWCTYKYADKIGHEDISR